MDSALSGTEYRLLVEHSPVMIWRSGLDAKCDYFNETWLAFTGRTMAQERGDGWAEGVHGEDLARCVETYLDHFRRREAFEMEYRLRRHDGVYRWIFDRGVPYTDDRGEFAGFIGSCIDVHERRRTQREFEQWMLAIVSHDIRGPLGAITMGVELMKARARDDAKQGELAARVLRSAKRITGIVGDLLDLSLERQGRGVAITPAPTDLAAICREVLEEVELNGREPIRFYAPASVHGTWDGARLAQAISNLVYNALKHGAADQPVSLRVRGDDGHAFVQVHNGGAIPGDVLPTLFEPFSARSESTRGRDGLGLGLFIARAITTAHRGDLRVVTNEAEGTTFTIALPRG